MRAELCLPNGMREGANESCALCWGKFSEEGISDITESDGCKKFLPNAEDVAELPFGVSLKSVGGAGLICIHEESLETMSVASGQMEKFGGI